MAFVNIRVRTINSSGSTVPCTVYMCLSNGTFYYSDNDGDTTVSGVFETGDNMKFGFSGGTYSNVTFTGASVQSISKGNPAYCTLYGRGTLTVTFTVADPPAPTYNHSLKYDANGGSGAPGTDSWTDHSSTSNRTISSVIPTRSGYRFLRWNTNSSGTGTDYSPGGTIAVGYEVTLYAKWEQLVVYNYKLSYDANGGSGGPSPQTHSTTDTQYTFTVSSTTPTLTDYNFNGWHFSGETTLYHGGDTVTLGSNLPQRTLYASWSYAVANVNVYNSNGSSATLTNIRTGQSVSGTGTVNMKGLPGDRWRVNAVNGSRYHVTSITLPDGTVVTGASAEFTTPTAANYSVQINTAINTYTVTLQALEGTTLIGGGGTYNAGSSVTIIARANTGYDWAYFEDEDGNRYRGTQSGLNFSYTFTIEKNKTFKAVAVKQVFTITTIVTPDGYGVVDGGGEYAYGDTATLAAVAYTGYTFLRWGDGDTNLVKTITVTKDETYIAYFALATYNVYLSVSPAGSGTVSGAGAYTKGSQVQISATPNYGYRFLRWSDNNTQSTRTIVVDSDVSLIAYFSKGLFNVSTDVYPDEHAGVVDGADTYYYGERCNLTAYPSELHRFEEWSDGDTSNPKRFNVYNNNFFAAKFIRWANIYVGESRVKKICIGDTEILKLAVGDTNAYLY